MLQTNLLVRTIYVDRPRAMIHQLRQVNRATKCPAEMKRIAGTFKAGEYVRVVSGLMRGTEGYVKYDGTKAVLCLNVEILGQCVEVVVSPDCVERFPDNQNKNQKKGSGK